MTHFGQKLKTKDVQNTQKPRNSGKEGLNVSIRHSEHVRFFLPHTALNLARCLKMELPFQDGCSQLRRHPLPRRDSGNRMEYHRDPHAIPDTLLAKLRVT
ncbi:MAG: hypothetical protein MZV65_22205 [Chromatiales bacterium]|nr:hypothetical protein [Chromatiales bacterium]